VVDASNSMNDLAPGSLDRSKWSVTAEALSKSLDSLAPETGVGMKFYPLITAEAAYYPRPVTMCINSSSDRELALLGPAGSPARTAIANALGSIAPQGGTPTHDAWVLGKAALDRSTLEGARFMVLITDGQPTYSRYCIGTGAAEDAVSPEPIIRAIQAARDEGVRTFIIGAPGSERSSVTGVDTRPWLSRAASTGGTAREGCSDAGPNYCHFDMSVETSFADGLAKALATISEELIACEYQLPAPPQGQTLDPKSVNVIYTPGGGVATLVPKSEAAACTSGWRFSDDGKRVLLCPNTCDQVRADRAGKLELLFGCATVLK
jgi:hypothetical protein